MLTLRLLLRTQRSIRIYVYNPYITATEPNPSRTSTRNSYHRSYDVHTPIQTPRAYTPLLLKTTQHALQAAPSPLQFRLGTEWELVDMPSFASTPAPPSVYTFQIPQPNPLSTQETRHRQLALHEVQLAGTEDQSAASGSGIVTSCRGKGILFRVRPLSCPCASRHTD